VPLVYGCARGFENVRQLKIRWCLRETADDALEIIRAYVLFRLSDDHPGAREAAINSYARGNQVSGTIAGASTYDGFCYYNHAF